MIYFVDLTVVGNHHFLYNSGSLNIISQTFPKETIKLFCTDSHYAYLKQTTDQNKVIQKSVFSNKDLKSFKLYNWIKKTIFDLFFLIRMFHRSKNENVQFIFITLMPVRSFYILFNLHKYFFSKQIVLLSMHGELEKAFSNDTNKTVQFHKKIILKLLSYCNKYFKILVPNPFVASNLINKFPEKKPFISSLYYHINVNPDLLTKEINFPIEIGHIGATESRKNSEMFFDLINLFYEQHPNFRKNLFKLVGSNKLQLLNSNCNYADKDLILERTYFENEIQNLTLSCILFRKQNYLYRDSGILAESFKFLKPIIGLKHPYFDFIENEFGKIGWFTNTIQELVYLIAKFEEDKETFSAEYNERKNNLYKYAEKYNMHFLKNNFIKLVD